MRWFKDLRMGQKILILVNVALIVVLIVLVFSGVGLDQLFALGILVGIMNIISIIFARASFKFGIALNTENEGDDVEPSDIKYLNWYIRWWSFTLVMLGAVICGLVFEK